MPWKVPLGSREAGNLRRRGTRFRASTRRAKATNLYLRSQTRYRDDSFRGRFHTVSPSYVPSFDEIHGKSPQLRPFSGMTLRRPTPPEMSIFLAHYRFRPIVSDFLTIANVSSRRYRSRYSRRDEKSQGRRSTFLRANIDSIRDSICPNKRKIRQNPNS